MSPQTVCKWTWWSPAIVVIMASLGCRGTPETKEPAPSSVPSTTVPTDVSVLGNFSSLPDGRTGCSPPSPISNYEMKATSSSSETAFGLVMAHRMPIRQGDEVKIVWRITGSGDLSVRVSDPTGTDHELSFGPDRHDGSTYTRPGNEWGIGIVFDLAGCWHIEFQRQNWIGDAWILIDP